MIPYMFENVAYHFQGDGVVGHQVNNSLGKASKEMSIFWVTDLVTAKG